jgi:hypothetical protein
MSTAPYPHGLGRPFSIPIRREPAGPEDRLPPANLDAERGVLGAILLDNAALAEVLPVLKPEDFFLVRHQVLFRTIRDLHELGWPVDGIILAEELRRREQYEKVGGDDALADLLNSVPHAANARYHAQIVRQKATARDLVQGAQEILRDGYASTHTAEEMLDRALGRIESVAATAVAATEEPEAGPRPWPAPPRPEAWHGLAGEIVRKIEPHTEADPIAILMQFLVAFGNLVGRRAYWQREATRHYGNLFCCVVGSSAKARKGTSWDHVRRLLASSDHGWDDARVQSNLSSGEGLIWLVRDPVIQHQGKKVQGRLTGHEEVEIDPGIQDKRLLVVASEFSGILSCMRRDGNTLSTVLRNAWDNGRLDSPTKHSTARCSNAHISCIGHITIDELRALLSSTDVANGFANRFLWVCARRSKRLPHGGQITKENFTDEHTRLKDAVAFAADEDYEFVLDREAMRLWEDVYDDLTEARPGALGSIVSRAEAQAMRLAFLYALLDKSPMIRRVHLEAGLALWDYCDRSACYIFGDALSDPVAERILEALDQAGPEGLTRTQIGRLLGRRTPAEKIDRALGSLAAGDLAEPLQRSTGGRPAEIWARKKRKKGSDLSP